MQAKIRGKKSCEARSELNRNFMDLIDTKAHARLTKGGLAEVKRRKAGGVFRHTISSLKKVARLPNKDRNEVLRILKKTERRRKVGPVSDQLKEVSQQVSSDKSTSSASVNNDWQHWVVLQGNAQVAEDDVRKVGKAIGITVDGDNGNMFSVLARASKGNKSASGQTQGGGCGQ
ncbi:hypothetical protein TSUD_330090 [Trifolium subterraneum]|nr:hypothetical protein TSUD_330090 [Trifolium subterraneum]